MNQPVDGKLIKRSPSPPSKWRGVALDTARAVRREMARVYNHARAGKINVQEAARLVYILGEIRRSIEVEELESRLGALEQLTETKK